MRKLFVLAVKEIWLTLRDVTSLLLMIATPFALTLAIAAAFGGSNQVAIQDLLVYVVNNDEGEMGRLLLDVLKPEATDGMLNTKWVSEEAAARKQVDADTAVALIIIPPTFSQQIIAGTSPSDPQLLEIYASPERPIGTLVVRSIVDQFLEQATLTPNLSQALGQTLASQTDLDPAAINQISQSWPSDIAANPTAVIELQTSTSSGQTFNWLNYFAPSLAMLFLLFSATGGGRTFITEKENGTLPRLLITPTPAFIILMGKMTGTIINGLIQVGFLWLATSLIGADWGEPTAVALGLFILVICASGLGAIIATWTQNVAQANIISAGVVMIASVLAGNFYPRMDLPEWVQSASLLTPNGWGLELFLTLQSGADWAQIWPLLAGMAALAVVYYIIAALGFRRQYV